MPLAVIRHGWIICNFNYINKFLTKKKNMKNFLLIGILIFLLSNCEKSDNETMDLNGAWLEESHKTDTLVFDTELSVVVLNRGKELIGDFLVPKPHSGPYIYELRSDSINLNWVLSSVGVGKNYYYDLDSEKKQIRIGNFFVDSISNNEKLTFSKLP